MSRSDNYNNEKIPGLILDTFISIVIAAPFIFIDYRASIAVGVISIIILLLRRLIL
jgi:hypothetical protein